MARAATHRIPVKQLVVFVVLVTARLARADACPPAVALGGEAAVVQAVRDELAPRGIAAETARCPSVHARIERRGAQLVVEKLTPGGASIARTVSGPATAATVLESWARSDVAAPLLELRYPSAPPIPPRSPVPPLRPAARGFHVFAAAESSFGSDGSRWQGGSIGVCLMLGPICAATRLRLADMVTQPSGWAGLRRAGIDAYVGIDVPVAIGPLRLTPGVAVGLGASGASYTSTESVSSGDLSSFSHNTVVAVGPRAEIRAALWVPITAHVSVDVTVGAVLNQVAENAHGYAPDYADEMLLPVEPTALLRFAIGLHYGAR